MIVRALVMLVLGALATGIALPADATLADAAAEGSIVLAQAQGTRDGDLEPRYQPREPESPGAYNNDYLFAMTRGVSDAPIAPAGKLPLYVLTIPLDLVLLPFALIGGFFG